MSKTLLKALRVFATDCKYGTTLLGNRRGLSECAKLKLIDAGYIGMSTGNTGIYKMTPAGWDALNAHKEPASV